MNFLTHIKHGSIILVYFFNLLVINSFCFSQQKVLDFSVYDRRKLGPSLMESTFYIYDPLNENNAGTSFLLAHVLEQDTLTKKIDSVYYKMQNNKTYYRFSKFKYLEILVTAAHILKNIEGEYANLILRSKKGNDYETFDFPVKIRENGRPLWKQAINGGDVATIIISLPEKTVYSILVDDYLVPDRWINDLELNAGDDISCVGFPYKTPSNKRYFPILRSGKYASYRGLDSLNNNDFLLDFRVYPGNSGGPVFVDLKITINSKGEQIYTSPVVLGLVSEQLKSVDKMHEIDVAKVISAQRIFDTILSLAIPPDTYIKNYDANKK